MARPWHDRSNLPCGKISSASKVSRRPCGKDWLFWRQAGLKKLWKNIVNLAIDGHQEPGVPEKNDICLIIHIITYIYIYIYIYVFILDLDRYRYGISLIGEYP